MDACFKLKLKDRGFNDPNLGTGLAYMANDVSYKEHLNSGTDFTETVGSQSVRFLLISNMRSRSPHVAQSFMPSIRRTQGILKGISPQVSLRSPAATRSSFRMGSLTSRRGKSNIYSLPQFNSSDAFPQVHQCRLCCGICPRERCQGGNC